MKNNFKCPTCGKEQFISNFRDFGSRFTDKNNKTLKCDCKAESELEYINVKDGIPSFGKFTAMSREDKVKALKKRSKDHFEKKLKEKKHYMDNKKEQLKGI